MTEAEWIIAQTIATIILAALSFLLATISIYVLFRTLEHNKETLKQNERLLEINERMLLYNEDMLMETRIERIPKLEILRETMEINTKKIPITMSFKIKNTGGKNGILGPVNVSDENGKVVSRSDVGRKDLFTPTQELPIQIFSDDINFFNKLTGESKIEIKYSYRAENTNPHVRARGRPESLLVLYKEIKQIQ